MARSSSALNGFAALGDPTRRKIFELVAEQPSAVVDLARELPVSRPAVSQHLKVLKEAGLVIESAEGTRRIYRLDPRGIGAMRDWLDAHWATALDAFKNFVDEQADAEDLRMSIAPIVRTVVVKAKPARAFDLFANHMEQWWPKGRTIGKSPHVAIVVEPHAGGQWFERDAQGVETHRGKVLAWEPPSRLLLGWQINTQWVYDPSFVTEVELTLRACRRRRHAGAARTSQSRTLRRGCGETRRDAARRLAHFRGRVRQIR